MTDRPLNVLITDPHVGGGGQVRYVTNLATELVRLGHSPTIGCKAGSVLVERAKQAKCPADDRFVFRGGLRPAAWCRDLSLVSRFIREQRPDILHVNGSQDHWVCALANRLMGRPVCVVRTRHNTYPVHDMLPNRILNRNWTDFQIVVCEAVRRTLAAQRAFKGARLCSIHNGVDVDLFRLDPEARRRARREFGYGDEHVVCGIAARLVPAKGHEFLFRALAQLRDALPQLRLLVLGQGERERELKQLARDCGISSAVLFAGFRSDMAYCTQAFDIGVLPSVDCDTSSFSLKEEMAVEKPVVASDYGGLKEIVVDGVEGLVVPTGTVEPLAHAIRVLAEDPELRLGMGRAGRRRVLAEFTVQVFAKRTVEAYHQAIAVHRQRTAHLRGPT